MGKNISEEYVRGVLARVKHLILFHHDPERTDNELDSIQEDARSWFKTNDQTIQCTAAFEGLTLDL